jgi:hypothetical protein
MNSMTPSFRILSSSLFINPQSFDTWLLTGSSDKMQINEGSRFFVGYFMTLSASREYWEWQNDWYFGKDYEGNGHSLIEVLSWLLPWQTKETHKKSIFRPSFETETSRTYVRRVNAWPIFLEQRAISRRSSLCNIHHSQIITVLTKTNPVMSRRLGSTTRRTDWCKETSTVDTVPLLSPNHEQKVKLSL